MSGATTYGYLRYDIHAMFGAHGCASARVDSRDPMADSVLIAGQAGTAAAVRGSAWGISLRRDRRARPAAAYRDARYPYRAGSADRPPGRRRRLQPGDRRAAVHQPRHRRLPPAEGLRQARHQLAQSACSRASRAARRSTAGYAAGLIPKADPRTGAAVPAQPTIKTLSTNGSRLSNLTDAHRCASNIAWMS